MNVQLPFVAAVAASSMPETQDALDKGIAAIIIVVATIVGDKVSRWLSGLFGSKKKEAPKATNPK